MNLRKIIAQFGLNKRTPRLYGTGTFLFDMLGMQRGQIIPRLD